MAANDKFKFGGASSVGDLARNGGNIETSLTDNTMAARGAGFWSDMARQGGAVVALSISGTPVADGQDNVAYTGFTVTAKGGKTPYVYSLQGTWPTGITVNSSTGAVTGTPTDTGAFASISVRATDAHTNTADLTPFTLTIAP